MTSIQRSRLIFPMKWTMRDNFANVFRFAGAVIVTLVWGYGRWMRYCLTKSGWTATRCRKWGFSWPAYESPKPMRCTCGWVGRMSQAHHTMEQNEDPVSLCPRCGRGELAPVFAGKKGWAS